MTRYTDIVGWNLRTISIVMLAVLSVLPVSRALCTVMCDSVPAAEAAAHHHGAPHCPEAAADALGVQFEAAGDHDCSNHEAAPAQAMLKASERDQSSSLSSASLILLPSSVLELAHTTSISAGHSPGFGGTPPGTTPLPLRI